MVEATQLNLISNGDATNIEGDIIFIHGLGADARGTWHPEGKRDDNDFWPVWLGEDLPNFRIWTLDYEVEPSRWRGLTLPLVDSAIDVLSELDLEIGDRPIFFIAHSMGGLLVKQMLRQGWDYGNPLWKKIVEQTKGITYISTPHFGSDVASLVSYVDEFLLKILKLSISVEELKAHHPYLRDLAFTHRNHDIFKQIPIEVYVETRNTMGVRVVNETSADPGIEGVIPIPLRNEDHISICRPKSKESRLYRRTKRFIEEGLKVKSLQPLPELKNSERDRQEKETITDEKVAYVEQDNVPIIQRDTIGNLDKQH